MAFKKIRDILINLAVLHTHLSECSGCYTIYRHFFIVNIMWQVMKVSFYSDFKSRTRYLQNVPFTFIYILCVPLNLLICIFRFFSIWPGNFKTPLLQPKLENTHPSNVWSSYCPRLVNSSFHGDLFFQNLLYKILGLITCHLI